MAFRLTPSDTSFFDLLAVAAQHGVEASRLLTDLLGARGEEALRITEQLRDVEAAADETTHEVVRKVNAAFITPFDHVDIVELAAAIDTCVDEIESVGFLIGLYRIPDLPADVVAVIEIISRMAQVTADAMPRLQSMKLLDDYWIEVNRLENQADQLYRRLLTQIFDGSITDPIQVVQRKDLIEGLERAADSFEVVAQHVEMIAVKES